MSDDDVAEPPNSIEALKDQLSATAPFGCGYAALLGVGMAFVVFVGSTIGDCEPGPGCHDNDGAIIGIELLKASMIAAAFALVGWALFVGIRMVVGPHLGRFATNSILAVCLIVLLWLTFSPAIELLLMVGE